MEELVTSLATMKTTETRNSKLKLHYFGASSVLFPHCLRPW